MSSYKSIRATCALIVSLLVFSSPCLHASTQAEEKSQADLESLVEQKIDDRLGDLGELVSLQKKNRKSQNNEPDRKRVHFTTTCKLGPKKAYFNSVTLGVGFLRFSGQKGSAAPDIPSNTAILRTEKPHYQGGTGYNRTPLIDATAGLNLFRWWALGVAYVGQHNVIFERNFWSPALTSSSMQVTYFRANVDLNAVIAKMYVNIPVALVIGRLYYTPYLAFGIGPSWQTWTPVFCGVNASSTTTFYRQKISQNCFFMIDAGFQVKNVAPKINFSLVGGLKFNYWGQARSMGAKDQQRIRQGGTPVNTAQVALSNPWRIRTVYQFAPYLGLMWSY